MGGRGMGGREGGRVLRAWEWVGRDISNGEIVFSSIHTQVSYQIPFAADDGNAGWWQNCPAVFVLFCLCLRLAESNVKEYVEKKLKKKKR